MKLEIIALLICSIMGRNRRRRGAETDERLAKEKAEEDTLK
jgi:hypothetical protein